MILVAASAAPEAVKRIADFICDGIDDQVEVNAALELGPVLLSEGHFYYGTPTELGDT